MGNGQRTNLSVGIIPMTWYMELVPIWVSMVILLYAKYDLNPTI